MFGYSLMAAGASRVVEICLFLQDGPSDPSNIKIFQYLPPYVSEHSLHSTGSARLIYKLAHSC
jgi:hypothetical protein